MRGMTDHASTSKGGLGLVTPLVEDGWEERSSDEDDFIKLTQHYVGGGWSHQDDPEISIPIAVKKTPAVMEDDLDEKEDNRNFSPSLKDDQKRLVTLEERLVNQRDEAGRNQPSRTSLTLIEGDQPKGGPSQVEVVTNADTLQGSGFVPMLGTTAQHRGVCKNNSSLEDRHFVNKYEVLLDA